MFNNAFGDTDLYDAVRVLYLTEGDIPNDAIAVQPKMDDELKAKIKDAFLKMNENEKGKEIGSGVFNGEIGTITEVNEREKVVEIKFDDEKEVWYQYNELEQIEHAYAITVHKAQRK